MTRRFLALYSGSTIPDAELVAISCNRDIVQEFGRRLIFDELAHGEPTRENGLGYDHRNNSGHGSTRDYWEEEVE